MTPSDTKIDYELSTFLHLHNDFLYNSHGSTCACHYPILVLRLTVGSAPRGRRAAHARGPLGGVCAFRSPLSHLLFSNFYML